MTSTALTESQRFDVIIVGGGLSACAVATALARPDRKILMLEARKGPNPRFNGELIHPAGVAVLEELRVLDALHQAHGADVDGFAVLRGAGAATTLLPYHEIENNRLPGFAIDHHDLVETLRAHALAQPGVELRIGERVTEMVRDEERVVGVRTLSGPVYANLVIACDGRHSKSRALLGIKERARLLSFTAAALLEDCVLPEPGFGHIFLGAWGPILAYPIRRTEAGAEATTGRTCIDLPADLDETPSTAQGARGRGTAAVIERIRADYLHHLTPGVRRSLERALDRGEIEMAANYSIATDECTVPGAALVGDACGCSHPLTATGMTIALTDTRLLRDQLATIDLSDRTLVDGALERYQQNRYRYARAREILADALYEVFRGVDDGTRAIREGIFRYWRGSVGARARSMALLSGSESRLPAFLREYLTVVSLSTSTVLRGEVNESSLSGRMRSLVGLGRKSYEKLELVARHVQKGNLR